MTIALATPATHHPTVNARVRRYARDLAAALGPVWQVQTGHPHLLLDDMGQQIAVNSQGVGVLQLVFISPNSSQQPAPLNIVCGASVAAVAACIRAEWLTPKSMAPLPHWDDVAAGALRILGERIAHAATLTPYEPGANPWVRYQLGELERVGRYLLTRAQRHSHA